MLQNVFLPSLLFSSLLYSTLLFSKSVGQLIKYLEMTISESKDKRPSISTTQQKNIIRNENKNEKKNRNKNKRKHKDRIK